VNEKGETRPLDYLQAYPEDLQEKVRGLIAQGGLADLLRQKYPQPHGIRTDGALYNYVTGLKNDHLRHAEAVNKVAFDSKIHVIRHALGLHTTISRVQGGRLKAKREIRVAALFRDAPLPFLRMIAVHELAHLRERDHGRAFYQLCEHMEPAYHQLEFDVRLYLTHLDLAGERLWVPAAA
jgi:predicted metal-dependent hydrolase